MFVTAVVHCSTCPAQRSTDGELCPFFFFFLRFFLPSAATGLVLLASAAKGLAKAASSPAAPSVMSEVRRETLLPTSWLMLSNDRLFAGKLLLVTR